MSVRHIIAQPGGVKALDACIAQRDLEVALLYQQIAEQQEKIESLQSTFTVTDFQFPPPPLMISYLVGRPPRRCLQDLRSEIITNRSPEDPRVRLGG